MTFRGKTNSKPSGEGFTKSELGREASRKHSLLTPFFVIGLIALTGCVNGLRSKKVVSDRAYFNASNQTLSQVVRSKTNPANEVDLIGNGKGVLAKPCTTLKDNAFGTTTTNKPEGPSTCQCAFRYFRVEQGNQESEFNEESPTIYRDSDLIRCSIPSRIQALGLTSVQVSVRYNTGKTQDSFSNEVPFNLTSGVGYAIDPTAASSFVRAVRFQCTAVLNFKPTYWHNVYDRDLSEDPRATTPMNFYTTNIGKSIAITSAGFKAGTANSTRRAPLGGWDCPSNPMDPRIQYSSDPTKNVALLNSTFTRTNANNQPETVPFQADFKDNAQPLITKYDMRIFSEIMRDSPTNSRTHTQMIYPPVTGQPNKSEFYVARMATGAFRIPINAIVAPGINTDPAGEKGPLPIGYGVLATSSFDGETCPTADKVPIPEGFKFAKLWLFRSSLVNRAVQGFGAAAIADGRHFDNKELACRGGNPTSGYKFTDNNPAPCVGSNCRFEIPFADTPATHYSTAQPIVGDWLPMELIQEARNNSTTSTQVFDYIYVVTPPSISREQMISKDGDARQYIPYRYISSLDCRDNSSAEGCIAGRVIAQYNLSEDIGYAFSARDQSLDQFSVNMGANTKFPLCVLVKKDREVW